MVGTDRELLSDGDLGNRTGDGPIYSRKIRGFEEEEALYEGLRPMAFLPPSERGLSSGYEDLQYSDFGEWGRMEVSPS
jgi:hypothetical protein